MPEAVPERAAANVSLGNLSTRRRHHMNSDQIKETVKQKYGHVAQRVLGGERGDCGCACDAVSSNLYDAAETAALPEAAVRASLGCGNPTALAALHAGAVVLDLGSGGGIDVLLSARRVGPTGRVYGLDMTDEMLALAHENQHKAGVANVEFLKGEIERIPLPDASVDVVISNCVINLSADKRRVLAEAFRVLKPGGRFAVSDVVVRGALPAAVRSEEHTSELQSQSNLVCRLLLEKKKKIDYMFMSSQT